MTGMAQGQRRPRLPSGRLLRKADAGRCTATRFKCVLPGQPKAGRNAAGRSAPLPARAEPSPTVVGGRQANAPARRKGSATLQHGQHGLLCLPLTLLPLLLLSHDSIRLRLQFFQSQRTQGTLPRLSGRTAGSRVWSRCPRSSRMSDTTAASSRLATRSGSTPLPSAALIRSHPPRSSGAFPVHPAAG